MSVLQSNSARRYITLLSELFIKWRSLRFTDSPDYVLLVSLPLECKNASRLRTAKTTKILRQLACACLTGTPAQQLSSKTYTAWKHSCTKATTTPEALGLAWHTTLVKEEIAGAALTSSTPCDQCTRSHTSLMPMIPEDCTMCDGLRSYCSIRSQALRMDARGRLSLGRLEPTPRTLSRPSYGCRLLWYQHLAGWIGLTGLISRQDPVTHPMCSPGTERRH